MNREEIEEDEENFFRSDQFYYFRGFLNEKIVYSS